eukprot:GFUD01010599.1.p1 GENE.GFUD01010599.1~~GFUD01010599.1.p1  ORF type:complete len:314 (+),score=59.55 GFUD01010599.1:128-1069(+)
MPWQPFRRKAKYREVDDFEMETSFDELLPRSASDGNLVRAPSERFLLQNFDPRKTYGTCSGGSSVWASFLDHVVEEGETLAGLSLRYNITIQDIKLANKLWTNEGLWPGRTLRIPVIEVKSTNLDLSGSSGGSDTMSTDSQISGLGPPSSSASSSSSRRLSSNDSALLPNSTSNSSCHGSPISLPLHNTRSPLHRTTSQASAVASTSRATGAANTAKRATSAGHRASVEDLSSFLSKMDSSIAVNKKASITLIKSSKLQPDDRENISREGVEFMTNNNTSDGRGQRGGGVAGAGGGSHPGGVGGGYQGYDNIC